ncbi:MAG: hypothetical protein VKM17_04045 [Cyanobacteriota bacterium]|nr:hypothetical protein [Cyanobacteriota bacterium]
MKRLEQLAALVVAAGLALVSYWLFFSWAQGGGVHRRRHQPSPPPTSQLRMEGQTLLALEPSPGLEKPLLGGAVVQAGDVLPDLIGGDG